jgi:hypothetical protein
MGTDAWRCIHLQKLEVAGKSVGPYLVSRVVAGPDAIGGGVELLGVGDVGPGYG